MSERIQSILHASRADVPVRGSSGARLRERFDELMKRAIDRIVGLVPNPLVTPNVHPIAYERGARRGGLSFYVLDMLDREAQSLRRFGRTH